MKYTDIYTGMIMIRLYPMKALSKFMEHAKTSREIRTSSKPRLSVLSDEYCLLNNVFISSKNCFRNIFTAEPFEFSHLLKIV